MLFHDREAALLQILIAEHGLIRETVNAACPMGGELLTEAQPLLMVQLGLRLWGIAFVGMQDARSL